MLNTINNSSKTEIKNPATGIIQQSNEQYFFLRFHQTSQMAKEIFSSHPKHEDKKVSVIQVLLIGDGWLLAECIFVSI